MTTKVLINVLKNSVQDIILYEFYKTMAKNVALSWNNLLYAVGHQLAVSPIKRPHDYSKYVSAQYHFSHTHTHTPV